MVLGLLEKFMTASRCMVKASELEFQCAGCVKVQVDEMSRLNGSLVIDDE